MLQAKHWCKESGMAQTIILSCWQELDLIMDKMMPLADRANPKKPQQGALEDFELAELAELKAQARGMAKILVLWTQPVFNSPEAIAKESMARYRARQSATKHYTPGTEIALTGEDLQEFYKQYGVTSKHSPDGYGTPANAPVIDPATERKLPTAPQARRRAPAAPKPPAKVVDEKTAATIRSALASGMFSKDDLAKMYKLSVSQVEAIDVG